MNMGKKVILGGTFHELHKGHEKMLNTALEIGSVTVGLVSDEFLKRWKPDLDAPYGERKKELEDHLSAWDDWTIVPISDPYSEAVEGDHDVLVVSWDTKERGEEINEIRQEKGRKPLELVVVPPCMAEDLIPISSTRIRQGVIDREGNRISPLKIHVGSSNSLKIRAVEQFFDGIFDNIEVHSIGYEDIIKQPIGEVTIKMACERALVPDGFDYGVGIESGIFEEGGVYISREYAVIRDSAGHETIGHGPGFTIPKRWSDRIQRGESLGKISEVEGSSDMGTIDFLSKDRLKREGCIKHALTCAMVSRWNSSLYMTG